MTKSHFEFIAKLISQVEDVKNRNNLACEAAAKLSFEFPRFKTDVFMAACKVDFWAEPA